MKKPSAIKITNPNTCTTGDTVFWLDDLKSPKKGIIKEIIPNGDKTLYRGDMALVADEKHPSTTGVLLSQCWPTKEDCLHAEKTRAANQIHEYKNNIRDVKDLICFMYTHDLTSENKDHEADAAVKAKAMELLGVDLDKLK